eukprot:5357962-Pyramimonas_sp.AAC.1
MAAGQNYGNQVRENGNGRKMGPPGIHAGTALMEGIQELASEWQQSYHTAVPASMHRAMGTLSGPLKLMEDNGKHSQAMITETINMYK